MTKYNDCEKCDGLGYYPAQNGPDDYEVVECGCFEKVKVHPMSLGTKVGIWAKYIGHLNNLPAREALTFKGGALGKPTILPF